MWIEDGEIQVTSTLGQGSVFWFEIDLPARESLLGCQLTSSPSRLVGFRGQAPPILIMDERPDNRAIVVNFLSPLGFEIVEAATREEGLAQAKQSQPGLILLDLVKPGLDGEETIRLLRQESNLSQVAIIAIVDQTWTQEQPLSSPEGCDAFLPKPIDFKKLLEMIEVHLGVEWIYESISPTHLSSQETVDQDSEENDSLSPKVVIVAPPTEELTLLMELAKQGNIARILERVSQIKQLGSQYEPFAQRLAQLAESFQEKKLRQFIEKYFEERS